MRKNNFGTPNFNPQLHLFGDNSSNLPSKQEKVTPKIEENNMGSLPQNKELIISKYKIGSKAIKDLTYRAEEATNEDETSGWYVKGEKLSTWYSRMESLYNDNEDDYEFSWQRLNNK